LKRSAVSCDIDEIVVYVLLRFDSLGSGVSIKKKVMAALRHTAFWGFPLQKTHIPRTAGNVLNLRHGDVIG